jgi:hypothetical protein
MALLTLAVVWSAAPAARHLLIPLLLLGGAAALTWRWGDLKWWWGVVEVYPIFAILLLTVLFRLPARQERTLFIVIVCFAAAQLLDTLDASVLHATGAVSGHTLKHIVGSAAGLVLLRGTSKP